MSAVQDDSTGRRQASALAMASARDRTLPISAAARAVKPARVRAEGSAADTPANPPNSRSSPAAAARPSATPVPHRRRAESRSSSSDASGRARCDWPGIAAGLDMVFFLPALPVGAPRATLPFPLATWARLARPASSATPPAASTCMGSAWPGRKRFPSAPEGRGEVVVDIGSRGPHAPAASLRCRHARSRNKPQGEGCDVGQLIQASRFIGRVCATCGFSRLKSDEKPARAGRPNDAGGSLLEGGASGQVCPICAPAR